MIVDEFRDLVGKTSERKSCLVCRRLPGDPRCTTQVLLPRVDATMLDSPAARETQDCAGAARTRQRWLSTGVPINSGLPLARTHLPGVPPPAPLGQSDSK